MLVRWDGCVCVSACLVVLQPSVCHELAGLCHAAGPLRCLRGGLLFSTLGACVGGSFLTLGLERKALGTVLFGLPLPLAETRLLGKDLVMELRSG